MSDRRKSTRPDPEPPETPPPVSTGHKSQDVALRYTFRAELTAPVAHELDRAVAEAIEADAEPVTFPAAVAAAADDLASVAAYLDHWADNQGDGVERHELRLAGAVLDAVMVIAEQAGILRAHARDAREGAPAARVAFLSGAAVDPAAPPSLG